MRDWAVDLSNHAPPAVARFGTINVSAAATHNQSRLRVTQAASRAAKKDSSVPLSDAPKIKVDFSASCRRDVLKFPGARASAMPSAGEQSDN
jgi:hypothetical protein